MGKKQTVMSRFLKIFFLFLTLFILASCSLFYQTKQADKKVRSASKALADTLSTLKKSRNFNNEIEGFDFDKEETTELLVESKKLPSSLSDAKTDSGSAVKELDDTQDLRLPSWYEKSYLPKKMEAAKEAKKGVNVASRATRSNRDLLEAVDNYFNANDLFNEAFPEFNDAITTFQDAFALLDEGNYAESMELLQDSEEGYGEAIEILAKANTKYTNAASLVDIKTFKISKENAEKFVNTQGQFEDLIDKSLRFVEAASDPATPVESLQALANEMDVSANAWDQALAKLKDVPTPSGGELDEETVDELKDWQDENAPESQRIAMAIDKTEELNRKSEEIKGQNK